MNMPPIFSKKPKLFKVKMICQKVKWKSSTEKYWKFITPSNHSTIKINGILNKRWMLWKFSSKLPSVDKCPRKSVKYLQTWLVVLMKASVRSGLVLINKKERLLMLFKNSMTKRYVHWKGLWNLKNIKFKKFLKILMSSRQN